MLSAKIKAVFILYLIAFISSGTKIIPGKGALLLTGRDFCYGCAVLISSVERQISDI